MTIEHDTLNAIVALLTAMTVALTLLGLAVRFILLPWLRDHLVQPMKQVQKQVTENHHSNQVPTVLDRIDDVQQEVRSLKADLDLARDERLALRSELNEHTAWSARWADLIEREMDMLRREQKTEEEG